MAKADINSLGDNVFVGKAFVSSIDVERLGCTDGEISVEQYSPDRIVVSVSLDTPSVLVVSNNYSLYWTCKINGVDRVVFPAYDTFFGVFLDEGERQGRTDIQSTVLDVPIAMTRL